MHYVRIEEDRLRKITTYYYDSRIPLTKIAFPGVDEGRHKPRVFEHVYDDPNAVEPLDDDAHKARAGLGVRS